MKRRTLLKTAAVGGAISSSVFAQSPSDAIPQPKQAELEQVIKNIKKDPFIKSSAKISDIQAHLGKPECTACGMVIAWSHYAVAVDAKTTKIAELPPELRDKIKPGMSVEQILQAARTAGLDAKAQGIVMTKAGAKLAIR